METEINTEHQRRKGLHALSFIASIAIAYFFLIVMAFVFYLYNRNILGSIAITEYSDLTRGFFKFATANICYTLGLYAAFSTFPYSYRFRSSWTYSIIAALLYIIAIIAMTVTNLCDAVYFHYAGKRFTANEVFFLDNSNNITIIVEALKSNIILVITGFAIIVVWIWLYFRIRSSHLKFLSNKVHYISHSIVFVLVVYLIVIGMRGGFSRQTRPITISNAAQYTVTPEKGSLILSNPFCILRTVENKSSFKADFFSEEDAERIFTTFRQCRADSLSVPSQKGKNIIIFILESFSAEHSKKLYPDLYSSTLTPFLDSLMGEGYLLTQSYANGHKSIDALPSVLASIPSLEVPFATLPESLSPTDALGNMLKKHGYSTWFFNGSERSSMGYVAYSKIAGIDNFRTKEDYEAVHGNNDYDGYWGIWDGPFFRYMAEEINSVEQPFFSVMFSLTSHHPFIVPDNMKSILPRGYTKVHQPVSYTDRALRLFFDYAKQQSWYQNTMFVFVADHVSSEKYGPYAKTTAGSSHILSFYYTPDNSLKGRYDDITQQIDIMPSIATLIEEDRPVHCFGRSIFLADSMSNNNGIKPFAINYTGGAYQWIEGGHSYIFNGRDIVSAYDLTCDSLQKNNVLNSVGNIPEKRLKAFLQTYYNEIRNKHFTVE